MQKTLMYIIQILKMKFVNWIKPKNYISIVVVVTEQEKYQKN